jgi:predicted ABC-type ATPase
MDNKLIHGVFRRVNKGRVRDLLTGKIHESFTVAADQLFQRGYMNEDERIALSGVIGDVLPKFQEGIDDSVGNRPVDTKDLQAIAEMSMVERTNSRTKCMSCDAKPTVACHWANGHGMAWFCKKHFKEWLEEDDRDICGVWVLKEGECPEDIRKNPKGTEKIRKLGDDIPQKEIYSRIDKLTKRGGPGSGHHGHRGVRGQTGGSLPRTKGTHLGGLGVPDMKDASKRSFVSQRIMQVGGETVVALVSLRRLDVFKTKPYRLESRWYVKGRRGPATSEQQDAGTELLGELEISTVNMMEISGWSRSTYRTNLWIAPWGNVLIVPEKLTTRGGEGSGHFEHAGREGEVGGSASGKGGPTGGVARPRHAAGVTPVSGEGTTGEIIEGAGGQVEELPHEQELQMTTLQTYLDQPTQRSEDGIFGVAYTEESWTDLAAELMENQPPEIQEKMAEIEAEIREGSQSIEEHRDAETGEWTPERRALHERIIQGVMSEAGEAPERGEGEEKQIWITGGLPGAGKSSVLEYREAFPEGTVKIDSDKIKTMFPEYEGWNAALLHEESSAIVQEIFRRATSEGRDIVYDATLKTTNKAEGLITGLQDSGYGVNVIYVDVPMAMAMERAINRFATQGGRYVSPMYIATHDSKNVKTLATLRDNVNSWEHWDNSQPKGGEPTLLATGGMEDGGR